MRIVACKVSNYRNVPNTAIIFNETRNFIVGETNLGKSNLLDFLDICFNRRRFFSDDFCDQSQGISAELTITMSDIEIGHFNDYFSPTEPNTINILAKQEETDDFVRFYHKESGAEIPAKKIKAMNYIKYDSLRIPKDELSFSKGRGVGKFLNNLISKYVEKNSISEQTNLINKDVILDLVSYVNSSMSNIRPFREFRLQACTEPEVSEMLHKLITVRDEEGYPVEKLGYGLQFVLMITLSILSYLLKLNDDKARGNYIVESEGKKMLSIVLGLDEPEIHLHPYMQRNLIKYISTILSGEDDGFNKIIKDLFDIDELTGQAIIVTHSPNIILDDYSEVIRFCLECEASTIVSGMSFSFPSQTRKHLLKNMPFVKESYFSRGAIFVEGDSEYGGFKILANKVVGDLDEFGISIIHAGSADSIPQLINLFSQFKIPCTSIMDNDKRPQYESLQIENLFFTTGKDFEEEIFDAFELEDYIKFVEETNPEAMHFFIGPARSLGINIDPRRLPLSEQVSILLPENKQNLKMALKEKELSRLRNNKTILNGIDLCKYVTNVPDSYKLVISKSVELSQKCSV